MSYIRRITGGKPTYAKADLSRLATPGTISLKKSSLKTAESKKEDNVRDNSMPEEGELVQTKEDRMMEFNELEGYESLIEIMQTMNMPQQHEITLLTRCLKSYLGGQKNTI
jgi:hypothetical protein